MAEDGRDARGGALQWPFLSAGPPLPARTLASTKRPFGMTRIGGKPSLFAP